MQNDHAVALPMLDKIREIDCRVSILVNARDGANFSRFELDRHTLAGMKCILKFDD